MRSFFHNRIFTAIVWLLARLLLAYELILLAWDKLAGPGSDVWVGGRAGVALSGFLREALTPATAGRGTLPAWYAWLIHSVFLPNAVILSYLLAIGELLIGAALLLGLFTRFAVAMALVEHMALFYAGAVSTLPYVLPLELAILLLGYHAGHYGVDGLVLAKLSPWFCAPAEHEPSKGAAKVWEVINPLLILSWIALLFLVILWG